MRVVGLTGGIACGKSTVAGWLKEMGAAIIDADAISHALTAPGGEALPAIFAAFGNDVRLPGDLLDRQALGSLVFADTEARGRLNGILHPLIHAHMLAQIADCREKGLPIVIMDVPLLYETGMEDLADEVWCVSAPEALQIQRLESRDGLSRGAAMARIRSQWPLAEKEARADAVIDTASPESETRAKVQRLYSALSKRRER